MERKKALWKIKHEIEPCEVLGECEVFGKPYYKIATYGMELTVEAKDVIFLEDENGN